MPARAKWRPDGTSASPKPFDLVLEGLGTRGDRLQVASGASERTAWKNRRNAITEAWSLGGLWSDSVRGLAKKRFSVTAWYEARAKGIEGIRALMESAGAEPLRDVIRDYLKQTKATDTRKVKQRLERFAASLGKAPTVAMVTSAAVETFLSELTDLRTHPRAKKKADPRRPTRAPVPVKGSTVNRYRAVIGGMCTYAVRTGRMTTHPIAGKKVEKHPEPSHRLPELSADEYRDYLATARALRPDLVVMLLMLIHTGCDVGEAFGLTARDVDLEAGRVRYERPKTRRFGARPRFVPIPAVLRMELTAHVAEHALRGSQRLFDMVKRSDLVWLHKRAAESIHRAELTLKDLRHIAAISWVRAGVHIRLVSKWLGHRSLHMAYRYTDYEPGADESVAMAEKAAHTLTASADVTPIRKAL